MWEGGEGSDKENMKMTRYEKDYWGVGEIGDGNQRAGFKKCRSRGEQGAKRGKSGTTI